MRQLSSGDYSKRAAVRFKTSQSGSNPASTPRSKLRHRNRDRRECGGSSQPQLRPGRHFLRPSEKPQPHGRVLNRRRALHPRTPQPRPTPMPSPRRPAVPAGKAMPGTVGGPTVHDVVPSSKPAGVRYSSPATIRHFSSSAHRSRAPPLCARSTSPEISACVARPSFA